MLSVIIPAKNEPYLDRTINSCLDMAEGEVEVIAVLDGYWPEVPIEDRKGLTLIHHTETIGQRPACNEAAKLARGKYLMKLDAHCILDNGYDVKLAADCEYDWTVIPRRCGIKEEGWIAKTTLPRNASTVDYMRLTSPSEKNDTGLRAVAWPQYKKRPKVRKRLIDDVMTCQGSGWFLYKDRYWELGGLDEDYGHWGAMGCEIGNKAWLSGGRLVVNKKTWYAHWQRGRIRKNNGEILDRNRRYYLEPKIVKSAHKYAKDLWFTNSWPLQKHDFVWLLEKFAPVPHWKEGYPEIDAWKKKRNLLHR